MIRLWLGLYLLSAAWLAGTDHFYAPRGGVWAAMVVAAVALLCWSQSRDRVTDHAPARGRPDASAPSSPSPGWVLQLGFLLSLVPAAVFAPWPHRLGPLLVAGGVGLTLLASRPLGLRPVARGAVLAGSLFCVQDLALLAYKHMTAGSHELPWPLPDPSGGRGPVIGRGRGRGTDEPDAADHAPDARARCDLGALP